MRSRTSDKTGIYRHGAGWRAVVSQGRGRPQIARHFDQDTSFREMQDWRKDTQAQHRVKRKQRARRGTFAGDARLYLQAVTAMPSYATRKLHIHRWADIFGTMSRDRITSAMIRRERDRLLTEPRGYDELGRALPPLAPGTVNRMLRALSNLYRVLDGPHAENPVRHVEEAPEPEAIPRDLDYETIARILDELPDLGNSTKGEPRPNQSLTKIRLRVLAYTGLPAKQLMRLTPRDVDLERAEMRVPARSKGAGRRAAILPLLPQAVDAFRDLTAADAFGPFSTSSMWKSFALAAKRANVSGASPYSLRHSFLSVVLDVTGSLDAVMAFAQHASPTMARRYTLRAAAKLLQQQAAGVERAIGKTSPHGSGRNREKTGVGETISQRVKAAQSQRKTAKTAR